MSGPKTASRAVPLLLATLFGVVLLVGLAVMAVVLAYAYGVPGLLALAVACGVAIAVAVRSLRGRPIGN